MVEKMTLLLLILIPLLPLLAFVVNIFFGKRVGTNAAYVSLAAISVSFVISLYLFFGMLAGGEKIVEYTFDWLNFGSSGVKLGIMLDGLTAVMLVVVTTVSLLVKLYSIGYMNGDPRYSRFYAYLSMFTVAMLGLVLANNFLLLFISWELVGLFSYLLIGFWYEKKSASDAGKKAFITTKVGDLGFFAGLLLLFTVFGTFNFKELGELVIANLASGSVTVGMLNLIGILIFCGAVGKSAQFPLHVWLPDAMEGPTPVSALIHAATMVAAGVYLVTRIFVMLTADAMLVIAVVGAFTSLVAATIALTQNDIKKVLAYSTVSQLGYMVMSLGVGAYAFAFFHLVTHAFFKACLFLGSGSVIHSMHHEQDIRNMGGLKKKMPVTYYTFLISTLAISGIPLTSGFLSKDGILAGTLAFGKLTGHWLIPIMAFTVAGMTAFYMFRLVLLTFHGEPRDHHKYDHAHESPKLMVAPLVILAGLSIFIWYTPNPIGADAGWVLSSWIKTPAQVVPYNTRYEFMRPSTEEQKAEVHGEITHSVEYTETMHWAHYKAMFASLAVAGLGILIAMLFYLWKKVDVDKMIEGKIMNTLYRGSLKKWKIDELYDATAVNGTLQTGNGLSWFDQKIVDGAVNGSAWLTRFTSKLSGLFDTYVVDGMVNFTALFSGFVGLSFRKLQTGKVQTYIVFVVFGVIILLLLFKPF